MELHDALNQIAEIRQQMARSQVFRGYRSVTTACSALLAILAAMIQKSWIDDPQQSIYQYLMLWLGAAGISIAVIGIEILLRHRRSESPLQREITVMAIQQFVPTLVAGLLVTFVLLRYSPDTLWMLPGLWAILCSLGIFSSARMLPRGTNIVAGYYLLAGLICLAMARGEHAFSPWAMGMTFGCGQLLAAGVLYWTLERNHGQE